MTNWFVRINHRKDDKGNYYSQQVERRLYYNLATKKDVLEKIKRIIQNISQIKYLKEQLKANSFLLMFMNWTSIGKRFGLRRSPVNFAEKIQLIVST